MQAKKDIEFMKEIQERVRLELKGGVQTSIQRNLPNINQGGYSSVHQSNQPTPALSSSVNTPKLPRTES